MKLYVAMVGLPARGKSTLAKRIRSGLEQQGIRTAIFNNGELRRMLFGLESGSAEFFNPDNTRAQRLRDQITHQNMERARAWLDEGGDVAIIDATNGTVHQRVDLSATLRDRPVLFIECVNDDPLLLDASIRRKTRLPEFANMTQEEALESFRKRLAYYESVYTPVRKERCWIRVDAVDSCIQDEAPSNDLPYYAAIRDIISSRWVQDLYLVRHGETDYNREGRLGGDPSLTAKGIEQAEKLAAHFDGVDLPYIFTSTKQRSAETAAPLLRSRPNTISMALSEFDEINAGVCEGMRYSDVRDGMPLEYEARSHNKYGYIYPNGESYAMLKERVARGLRRDLKTRLSDIVNRYGFTKQEFSLCSESVLLHDARLCFQAECTGYLLNIVLFLCATPFGILSGGKYVYLASCIVYAAVAFAVKHAALRNMVRIQ